MKNLRTFEYSFLIGLSGFILLPLLYIFRRFDTNTLTNWQWIFSKSNYSHLLLAGLLSVALSYLLSRVRVLFYYKQAFLFTGAFMGGILFWGIPEVIIDAGRYFTEAKYLEMKGLMFFLKEWGGKIPVWTDLPGVPLIYGLLFKYIGEERILIQALNTLFFSCTVLTVYLMGKELWDEETGFYGGVFLASITYLYTQVPLMLVDVGSMFSLSFTVYIIIRNIRSTEMDCLKNHERNANVFSFSKIILIISTWAFVIFTILAKYSLCPMLLMALISLYIVFRKVSIYKWITVLFIPSMVVILIFTIMSDIFFEQLRLLRSFQWEGLKAWQEGLFSSFIFQSHPFIVIFSLSGIYRIIKKKEIKGVILLWPILFIFLFNARRLRYLIPLLPFITLLAGYGLRAMMDREGRRFLVVLSMVTALVIGIFFYKPFLMKISLANIREAAEMLNKLPYNRVLAYPLEQEESMGDTRAVVPLIDIYTEKKIICIEGKSEKRKIETYRTPLQFTWAMGCPEFYKMPEVSDRLDNIPRLYISSSIPADTYIPSEGYDINRFSYSTGRFRFRTYVTLLIPL